MIVIGKHEKLIVVTGWRAWLVGAAAAIVAWIAFAFLAFVLIGAAVTLGAMLVLILPAVLVVTALQAAFRRG